MGSKTPLYKKHLDAGAKIVDFGGWDMPLHYGSQLDEHHAVRQGAGLFDVSHMTVVDIVGASSRDFLRRLLANDVARLKQTGKALYTCMLNDAGGVIDDLIVYLLAENRYRLIVNAATRVNDLAWIVRHAAGFQVTVEERGELAMLAVQGPDARRLTAENLLDIDRNSLLALKPFSAIEQDNLFVARTGYTGEDGFEIVAAPPAILALWDRLVEADVTPCGLGARDTLRLEAGMNLYGTDMDAATSPLEAGLAWTVAWEPADRNFIGRAAVQTARDTQELQRFVGLLLESKGVLRNHQRVVVEGLADGEITSGGFSPTMQRSIAMARVPAGNFTHAQVEVRKRLLDVRIVKLPFVRNGSVLVE